MGRESLMVMLLLDIIIFFCIFGYIDIQTSSWYWNIELFLVCISIFYGFEFNDKSYFSYMSLVYSLVF